MTTPINHDDWRLTAHALGELDEPERSEIEAQVNDSEELQKIVAGIQATAGMLTDELANEPAHSLEPAQRAAILDKADAPKRSWFAPRRLVPIAMAAGLALVVGALLVPSMSRRQSIELTGGESQSFRSKEMSERVLSMMAPATVAQNEPIAPAKGPRAADEEQPTNYDLRYAPAEKKGEGEAGAVAERPKEIKVDSHDTAMTYPASNDKIPTSAMSQSSNGPTSTADAQVYFDRGPQDSPVPQAAAPEYRPPSGLIGGGAMGGTSGMDRAQAFSVDINGDGESTEIPPYTTNRNGPSIPTTAQLAEKRGVSLGVPLEGADKDKAFGYDFLPGNPNLTQRENWNREAYKRVEDNPFKDVVNNPLSTFSIDVDTASYSNVRRFLNQGQLPQPDAVRIEELVNYFDYDYAPPTDKKTPFAVHLESASAPWAPQHRLVRIGIKGWELPENVRPASNLVFLLDVSGSMGQPNKLPLLKDGMKMLVQQLDERDRVAIVVYAGAAGMVLPSTSCGDKHAILGALDRLSAGGSTNGGQGIHLAYDTAVANFIKGGVNRVILATDGDFNVGTTSEGELTRLIEEKANTGVFLSVLGFGMGNYQDARLESLADKGNGNYAYIDTQKEAKKVLVEEMTGTLITIAKDVKIQVEFNPNQVQAYRLIGYENRILAAEDFNDDTKDAGEIGAGHTVTALYEIVPHGVEMNLPGVDPLKYQQPKPQADVEGSNELLTVKLRYKAPDGDKSTKVEFPLVDDEKTFQQATPDFKFASGVAAFGMILRDSPYKGTATFDTALQLAQAGRGQDKHGYRAEFIDLVKQAKRISYRED